MLKLLLNFTTWAPTVHKRGKISHQELKGVTKTEPKRDANQSKPNKPTPNLCTIPYTFSVPQLQDELLLRLPVFLKKTEKVRRVHYRNIVLCSAYLQSSVRSLSSKNGCFHFACCSLAQIYAVVEWEGRTNKRNLSWSQVTYWVTFCGG